MENSSDRECYSLAAGLGLGLVVLGRGNDPTGLADLDIADTLQYYMVGGHKRPLTGMKITPLSIDHLLLTAVI